MKISLDSYKMFSKKKRKEYRDRAKTAVFAHIPFSVWSVICSDFIITIVMGFYSAMAEQQKIDILSPDIEMLSVTAIVMLMAELANFPLAFCARRGFLLLSRRNFVEPIPLGEVFEPFLNIKYLLKGTLIMMLQSLLVYLGSIPLFIFALPITYAYCMAPFMFLDDPSISPIKALTLSRRAMKGKKWGTFITVLPLVLLQFAVTVLLGNFQLLSSLITSVIRAIEMTTIASVYHEILLIKIMTE